jgi:hypothetical protein
MSWWDELESTGQGWDESEWNGRNIKSLPKKEGEYNMTEVNEARPMVEDLVEAGDSCSGGCGGSSDGCSCDSSGAMPAPRQ